MHQLSLVKRVRSSSRGASNRPCWAQSPHQQSTCAWLVPEITSHRVFCKGTSSVVDNNRASIKKVFCIGRYAPDSRSFGLANRKLKPIVGDLAKGRYSRSAPSRRESQQLQGLNRSASEL